MFPNCSNNVRFPTKNITTLNYKTRQVQPQCRLCSLSVTRCSMKHRSSKNVQGSDLGWLNRDRLQEVKTGLAAQHKWIPVQNLPFPEVVLYAYAADRAPFPTYVCLPSGLYKARTGQVVAQTGPDQEILPLSGIYFFDGWRVHPTLPIPGHLPRTKEAPVQDIALTAPAPGIEPTRSPEEERHPCDC